MRVSTNPKRQRGIMLALTHLQVALAYASGWCLFLACASGWCAEPLYQQRPYDIVTLDANNGNAALKVQPIDMPTRQLPPPQNRTGEIEIELLERPGERFKVAWFNITNLQFFEELVLAEAAPLVTQGKFDEAYEYYRFLETKYPKTLGLKEAFENFLWLHSGSEYKAGRFDQALALMVELNRRNPQRTGLSVAYARVTTKLVENRLAAGNYRAARGLLKNLAQRYPDQRATSVTPYETQLQAKAAALGPGPGRPGGGQTHAPRIATPSKCSKCGPPPPAGWNWLRRSMPSIRWSAWASFRRWQRRRSRRPTIGRRCGPSACSSARFASAGRPARISRHWARLPRAKMGGR